MDRFGAVSVSRVGAAVAFAGVFSCGLVTDRFEPGAEWIMAVAVIGFGAAVGRWRVLLLALIPVLLVLPEGTEGDPPAIPAAMLGCLLGAGLLAVGVGTAKALSTRSPDREGLGR